MLHYIQYCLILAFLFWEDENIRAYFLPKQLILSILYFLKVHNYYLTCLKLIKFID